MRIIVAIAMLAACNSDSVYAQFREDKTPEDGQPKALPEANEADAPEGKKSQAEWRPKLQLTLSLVKTDQAANGKPTHNGPSRQDSPTVERGGFGAKSSGSSTNAGARIFVPKSHEMANGTTSPQSPFAHATLLCDYGSIAFTTNSDGDQVYSIKCEKAAYLEFGLLRVSCESLHLENGVATLTNVTAQTFGSKLTSDKIQLTFDVDGVATKKFGKSVSELPRPQMPRGHFLHPGYGAAADDGAWDPSPRRPEPDPAFGPATDSKRKSREFNRAEPPTDGVFRRSSLTPHTQLTQDTVPTNTFGVQ